MKALLIMFSKISKVGAWISLGLSLFYFTGAAFVFSYGLFWQGLGCVVLGIVFLGFAFIGKFMEKAKLFHDRLISLVSMVEKQVTLTPSVTDQIKLKLILFQLDVEMFKKYKKVVTGVSWYKMNNRPDSTLIQSVIEYYFSAKGKVDIIKIQMTEEQEKFIKDFFQRESGSDLMKLYQDISEVDFVSNTIEKERIVFQ